MSRYKTAMTLFFALWPRVALAGMPSPLPSSWTATSGQQAEFGQWSGDAAPFLQTISFFVAILLAVAWAVKALWHVLKRDLAWLPTLSYWRSLGLVVLWGMLFIVV